MKFVLGGKISYFQYTNPTLWIFFVKIFTVSFFYNLFSKIFSMVLLKNTNIKSKNGRNLRHDLRLASEVCQFAHSGFHKV